MQIFEYRLSAPEGARDYEARMVVNALGEVLSLVRDVTERKALGEKLEQQAFYDALTSLPSRALFAARLEQACARRDRTDDKAAVLFVDIDDFKSVNDSLGHWAEDELLKRFAHRLEATVCPGDTVARFGGDECAVLLECTTERGAFEVAERMIEGIGREPFTIGRRQILATLSIGVAVAGCAGQEWADLPRRADLALHHAKE